MAHEHRPHMIICAACGGAADASDAREAQITWCLPNKRYADPRKRGGSHQDPQELYRSGVYMCGVCWKRKWGKFKQRRLWAFIERIETTLRQLAIEWVMPPTEPTDLYDVPRARRAA